MLGKGRTTIPSWIKVFIWDMSPFWHCSLEVSQEKQKISPISTPENAQGQAGRGLEQPGPVESSLPIAGVGMRWFFRVPSKPKHFIPWPHLDLESLMKYLLEQWTGTSATPPDLLLQLFILTNPGISCFPWPPCPAIICFLLCVKRAEAPVQLATCLLLHISLWILFFFLLYLFFYNFFFLITLCFQAPKLSGNYPAFDKPFY